MDKGAQGERGGKEARLAAALRANLRRRKPSAAAADATRNSLDGVEPIPWREKAAGEGDQTA